MKVKTAGERKLIIAKKIVKDWNEGMLLKELEIKYAYSRQWIWQLKKLVQESSQK